MEIPSPIRSAHEHAYEYVLQRILSSEFPAGTRLNLDEIARTLGVSRMPVREAIRRLSSEGLVTIYPRRGSTVTPLSVDDILDLAEIRELLEGLAIRRALPHFDPPAVQHLETLLSQMEAAVSTPELWLRLHDEFHDYLSSRSQSARLTTLVRQLRQSVTPQIRLFLSVYPKGEFPGVEHWDLIEVIKSRDPHRAEATLRKHVASTARALGEFLRATADARPPEMASIGKARGGASGIPTARDDTRGAAQAIGDD